MGDIIEITTRARHPTSFYRVSSGAISFELKSLYAGFVGLAKDPGNICDYWIGFGRHHGGGGGGIGKIWIKGPDGLKSKQSQSFNILPNQFKRFWIAWDSTRIKVGQEYDVLCVLSYPTCAKGLSYVTFTSHDPSYMATWRFELPPSSLISMTKRFHHKRVQGGDLCWIRVEEVLPDDAVIGGFQSECLYITRGHHAGSLTPGHFVPSEGVTFLSWGGATHALEEFEVLCGYNFAWEATSDNKIPVNAFEAGYSEVHREKLYIGRVKYNNCLLTGKVQPSHKVCYIPYEEKEVAFKNYDILVVPESNPYPARSYYENAEGRPNVVGHADVMNVEVNFVGDDDDDDDDSNYDVDDNIAF